jgi:hypothetical protein
VGAGADVRQPSELDREEAALMVAVGRGDRDRALPELYRLDQLLGQSRVPEQTDAEPEQPAAPVEDTIDHLLGRGVPGGGQPGPRPAPVLQTIHLTAATGGPASGVATVRDSAGGRVIELTVRDLPAPPAGHFYTCWLVADDDTLQHQDRISVGSFTTSGTGTPSLRWETAADLGRYPHLGVTLEPDNGSPLHQGPRVLSAST